MTPIPPPPSEDDKAAIRERQRRLRALIELCRPLIGETATEAAVYEMDYGEEEMALDTLCAGFITNGSALPAGVLRLIEAVAGELDVADTAYLRALRTYGAGPARRGTPIADALRAVS